jgi:hypothetical protein
VLASLWIPVRVPMLAAAVVEFSRRVATRGTVYAVRYGGHRCAVCFAFQDGWRPRGD